MEFLGTVLAVLFIALILGTALAFGFVLLAWFMAAALVVSAFLLLREIWRRCWFLYSARPPQVTDAEYEDLPPRGR